MDDQFRGATAGLPLIEPPTCPQHGTMTWVPGGFPVIGCMVTDPLLCHCAPAGWSCTGYEGEGCGRQVLFVDWMAGDGHAG